MCIKSFLKNDNKNICIGLCISMMLHIVAFVWFMSDISPIKKISPDVFTPEAIPVNVVFEREAEKEKSIQKEKPVQKDKAPQKKITTIAETGLLKTKQLKKAQEEIVTASKQNISNMIETKESNISVVNKPSANIPIVRGETLVGKRVQPEYPRRALKLKQEGVVILHVLISPSGTNKNIKIHRASKYAMLNQAAIKAVKKWTFDPHIVNGNAITSWVEIPIEFKIQ